MNQQTLSLSSSTRMLLACDGSTTILLEALTGERLSVRVDAQGDTTTDRLPDTIRSALRLPLGARVLERRSCLVTPDHEVVSVNRVVFDEVIRGQLGEPDSLTPLGSQLRSRQVPQHREQISSGLARWRDGRSHQAVDSVYKEYVINYATGGRAYVHEHFNPRLVRLTDMVLPAARSESFV